MRSSMSVMAKRKRDFRRTEKSFCFVSFFLGKTERLTFWVYSCFAKKIFHIIFLR